MNLKGLLTVFVAAALVLSVGMTSTSLDAVETDPSDQIDTSWIPTQDNNPQQSQSNGGSGDSSSSSSSSSSNSDSNSNSNSDSDTELEGNGDIDAQLNEIQGSVEDKMDLSSGDTEAQTKGGGEAEKTLPLWQRLLNLLLEYIRHILAALAGVAALVGGYVVYKRRFAGGGKGNLEIVYDVDTSNDVYRSWWEMVEMLDAEEPTTKTPQEFAEIAVDEGLEPEAVSELTKLFEEVLYGGKEVTKEKEKRARETVERLKAKGRKAV